MWLWTRVSMWPSMQVWLDEEQASKYSERVTNRKRNKNNSRQWNEKDKNPTKQH